MATPLTAIGKYTGVLTIFLGVLLMFAFVIADPLMQYAGAGRGPGGGGTGEVVARWDGGQINDRQLQDAVVNRNVLAEFQQQVYTLGYRDAQEDGVEDLGLRIDPIELPRSREQRVEADIIQKKIFAEKAREAGMVVSDEMIVEYLKALGRDRVSTQQMREILTRMGRSTGGGSRATIGSVFDLLREAMLANNYFKSHMYVIQTTLPEERWDDWKKLNERIVVEAAPIRAVDFVEEVPEPSDEELEAFYEDYKNRQPSSEFIGSIELPSRLPAFATPPRVKVSYLKADFEAAVERYKEQVTDEQIAEYYETNKESFVAADRSLFGDLDDDGDLLEDDTDTPAADETETAEEESAESSSEAEPQAEEDTSSTEPAEASEASEEPATDPAEAEPAETETSENPLRQEEAVEEEEEEEEDTASEGDGEAAPTADEAAAEEESAEDEPEYQSLEEVADEIRQRLAMNQAAEEIQQKMERIKSKLEDEFLPYFDATLAAQDDKDAEEPTPPESLTNLQPLAEAEGLELIELDQASQAELRGAEVGAAINANRSTRQPLPLWYEAFARKSDGTPKFDAYEPINFYDIAGNGFVVLVTERYEATTPPLDEMREQVVGEWKRLEAAKLALKKAEELAEGLSGKGTPLADHFAQQEEPLVDPATVQETDPFTLLTIQRISQQTGQPQLALSQPQPLVAPGPDLLDTVFDLGAGDVGAQLNHNHSIAYLLRIAQKIGTEDELRQNFIRDGDRWIGAGPLMQSRMQNKMTALVRDLLEESGLEELRPLDQLR